MQTGPEGSAGALGAVASLGSRRIGGEEGARDRVGRHRGEAPCCSVQSRALGFRKRAGCAVRRALSARETAAGMAGV